MTSQHIIIIVSAIGGIIGGMGMGGGTLLIPLLTLCAGLEQHLAQAINLMAFIPMSVIALVIHKKNGYVSFVRVLPITATALVGAVCGSFAAQYARGYVLRACFGAFLTVLGVIQTVKLIVSVVKSHKKKCAEKSSERAAQQS